MENFGFQCTITSSPGCTGQYWSPTYSRSFPSMSARLYGLERTLKVILGFFTMLNRLTWFVLVLLRR
jgi:hypothetical protein